MFAPVTPLPGTDPVSIRQLEPASGGYATVPVGDEPLGVAYDVARGEAFVTNSLSNDVSVVSALAGTDVATVAVGTAPAGIAYDSGMGELFVANFGSHDVSVINDTTDTVVATVQVGTDPTGVAYDSGLGQVFVTNYGSENMSVISDHNDTVLGSVGSGVEPLANPSAVMYDPVKNCVWIAEPTKGIGTYYPVADFHGIVSAGFNGWGDIDAFASDSAKSELFYAHYNTDDVVVMTNVPDDNELVATVPVGTEPMGEVYDSGLGEVLVANYGSNNVSAISDATNQVVGTVPVGLGPQGLAYDSANGEVFVANSGSDTVSILGAYNVTFTESGLPSGSEWFLNLSGGPSFSSTTNTIRFIEPNGAYTFTVATTNKDYFAAGGLLNVSGTPVSTSVPFVLQTFPVTFVETGLPAKTLAKDGWTVVMVGTLVHSTSASIVFSGVSNHTYGILVTGPSGETVNVGGSLTVSGTTTVPVTMAKGKTYTLTLSESGLPKGEDWCRSVNEYEQCTSKSSATYVNLTSGMYSYAVIAPLAGQTITAKIGKTVAPTAGLLDLTASTKIAYTFVYDYAVTFTESGLTSGTWSVTIKGVTLSNGTGDPIVFHLANGTYSYKVGAESGYTSVGTPKSVKVSGAAVPVSVTFTAKKGKSEPSVERLGIPLMLAAAAPLGRRRTRSER